MTEQVEKGVRWKKFLNFQVFGFQNFQTKADFLLISSDNKNWIIYPILMPRKRTETFSRWRHVG